MKIMFRGRIAVIPTHLMTAFGTVECQPTHCHGAEGSRKHRRRVSECTWRGVEAAEALKRELRAGKADAPAQAANAALCEIIRIGSVPLVSEYCSFFFSRNRVLVWK